jgi:hypothetical protein
MDYGIPLAAMTSSPPPMAYGLNSGKENLYAVLWEGDLAAVGGAADGAGRKVL